MSFIRLFSIARRPNVSGAKRSLSRAVLAFGICSVALLGLSACSPKKVARHKPLPQESAAAAASTPAPAPVAVAPKVILKVHGSAAVGEKLLPELAKEYLKQQGATDVKSVPAGNSGEVYVQGQVTGEDAPRGIEIFSHGTASGFKDLKAGACDVAMAARKITSAETQDLQSMLGDATAAEHLLCLDAVAVIVNKANPTRSLSMEQVVAIFSGDSTDWSKIGLGDGAIHIMAPDEHGGARDFFSDAVLGTHGKKLADGATRFSDSTRLSDAVNSDENAIGFISLSHVGDNYAVSVSDKGRVANRPTEDTIKKDDYLLSRRLYLYAPGEPANAEAASFIKFVFGSQGAPIIASAGFVKAEASKTATTAAGKPRASRPAETREIRETRETRPVSVISPAQATEPRASSAASEIRERDPRAIEEQRRIMIQRASAISSMGVH